MVADRRLPEPRAPHGRRGRRPPPPGGAAAIRARVVGRLAGRALSAALRPAGLEVVPRDQRGPLTEERLRVLANAGVTAVLDVGANTGQFARSLRAAGYTARIVSFEPVAHAFTELADRSRGDAGWEARRLALSDSDGTLDVHVAANSVSSSVLAMTDEHLDGAPGSRYVGVERVAAAKLDTLADELLPAPAVGYLKLDVQGYEPRVLEGASAALQRIAAVECELSLTPLYDGQALLPEVVAWLDGRGYDLIAVERSFSHPRTRKLLQLDGLFVRRS